MFASETCALDVVGAKFVRDVEPGEIVRVKDGKLLSKIYTKDPLQDKICAMEYIYFSRPDSNLDGINVHTTRKLAGKQLYYEILSMQTLLLVFQIHRFQQQLDIQKHQEFLMKWDW